jgi:hypothetical protein
MFPLACLSSCIVIFSIDYQTTHQHQRTTITITITITTTTTTTTTIARRGCARNHQGLNHKTHPHIIWFRPPLTICFSCIRYLTKLKKKKKYAHENKNCLLFKERKKKKL